MPKTKYTTSAKRLTSVYFEYIICGIELLNKSNGAKKRAVQQVLDSPILWCDRGVTPLAG